MTTNACINSKSLMRRGVNRILHKLARVLPGSTSLRPALHRLRGVQIGRGVFIGDEVYLENEYPELIKIGDGTAIGLRSVIMAHVGKTSSEAGGLGGHVTIGRNVWIGACSFIASSPGTSLSIGDGAVVGACSVIVNRNVPTQAFVLPPMAQQVGTARVALTAARSYREFLGGLYAGDLPEPSDQ
ncbi:MAG TPA: DapH/DapD/GlmU-related protein [Candidatus Sulfotelmatobacter sp.]|nr:DapH/DapD/GlmU-related protein [Candidatus Sulfotelmatobacter sp.]